VSPAVGPALPRLSVGVIGCGIVAQVMHLPYLRELADRFEVRALCDVSPTALAAAGETFPRARHHTSWQDLLAEPLDVVLVLTPGSHAPIAIAAAEAGRHVFVEKPMCFSVDEGREMLHAADRAGVRLMVGYMKRYDPAFERLEAVLAREDVRLARVTTLESPLDPYVAHYPLRRADDVEADVAAALLADDERRMTAAVNTDDPVLRRAYRAILLDSMVHELNAVRALLGEPAELSFADVWGGPTGITATLVFGETKAVFMWVDLPGIARYEGELAFFAPDERTALRFPSPFLRSMPTELVREGGEPGTAAAWRTVETVSYDEAFKRELVELHDAIVAGREPRTSGEDALRDVALAQAVVRCVLEGGPVPVPSEWEEHASRAVR
jgi:predicted dehydrogenase